MTATPQKLTVVCKKLTSNLVPPPSPKMTKIVQKLLWVDQGGGLGLIVYTDHYFLIHWHPFVVVGVCVTILTGYCYIVGF